MDLVVLAQGIDTSTAVGRMFFKILGTIAAGGYRLPGQAEILNPTQVALVSS